ncbi:MAG: hypothetical protein ACPGJV_11280 [Bacteriovoracaceae bacterium]
MKRLSMLALFSFSLVAGEPQLEQCREFGLDLQDGDSFPKSCYPYIKQGAQLQKRISLDDKILSAWVYKNLLLIESSILVDQTNNIWRTQKNVISGDFLNLESVVDLDISPDATFAGAFEIHLLINTGAGQKVLTYLSTQKNRQHPRVYSLPGSLLATKVYRGDDHRLWLKSTNGDFYSFNSFETDQRKTLLPKKLKINRQYEYIFSNKENIYLLSSDQISVISDSSKRSFQLNSFELPSKSSIHKIWSNGSQLILELTNSEQQVIDL